MENPPIDFDTETILTSDPKKVAQFGLLSPLVKIDYEPVQVDSNSEELGKCDGVQYELPLDSEWEMDRSKYVPKKFICLVS